MSDSKNKINYIKNSGETKGNTEKIIQGQTGGELTDKGINQAIEAGKRLGNIQFDKIICSDLNRARKTLDEIIKFQTTKDITYTPLVRDIYKGKYHLMKIKDFIEQYVKPNNSTYRKYKCDDTENFEDVFKRANTFVNKIINEYVNSKYNKIINIENMDNSMVDRQVIYDKFKNSELTYKDDNNIQKNKFIKILLVSHGGFIKELINNLILLIQDKFADSYALNNCGLFRVFIYCNKCQGKCKDEENHCNDIITTFDVFNDLDIKAAQTFVLLPSDSVV